MSESAEASSSPDAVPFPHEDIRVSGAEVGGFIVATLVLPVKAPEAPASMPDQLPPQSLNNSSN